MPSQRKRLEKIVGRGSARSQAADLRWFRAQGWTPPQEPTPPPEPPTATPPDQRCTFCGGRAVRSDHVRGNPEQVLFCCKRLECLGQWRKLVADDQHWHPANQHKRKRKRRRRQRTREP